MRIGENNFNDMFKRERGKVSLTWFEELHKLSEL